MKIIRAQIAGYWILTIEDFQNFPLYKYPRYNGWIGFATFLRVDLVRFLPFTAKFYRSGKNSSFLSEPEKESYFLSEPQKMKGGQGGRCLQAKKW